MHYFFSINWYNVYQQCYETTSRPFGMAASSQLQLPELNERRLRFHPVVEMKAERSLEWGQTFEAKQTLQISGYGQKVAIMF